MGCDEERLVVQAVADVACSEVVVESRTVQDTMSALRDRGVGTRPFFYPIHQQPVFRAQGWFSDVSAPVSESLYQRGFYIPSGLGIQDHELERVAEIVLDVVKSTH